MNGLGDIDVPLHLPRPSSQAQFSAWRSRQLPEVEQVRDGVWSMPLPLPDTNPMHYVNCYVLIGGADVTVVDPGWDHMPGRHALERGLGIAGASTRDVTQVVVTHFHPDHYGLAPWLRESSGARIVMHPRDGETFNRRRDADERLADIEAFLRSCGAPDSDIAGLVDERDLIGRYQATPGPDVLHDGSGDISAGGREVELLWTPGHTPGHLCVLVREMGLLITGDHVLPRVSPNVSVYRHGEANPLGDFLTSLRLLRRHESVEEVLPAHEYRFGNLAGRLTQLESHHDERLEQVLEQLRLRGSASSWDVAEGMTWSRPFNRMGTYGRRSANGEILAHLVFLEAIGNASRTKGEVHMWSAITDRMTARPGARIPPPAGYSS